MNYRHFIRHLGLALVLLRAYAQAMCMYGTQVNYYHDSNCASFAFSRLQCEGVCTMAGAGSALLVTDDAFLQLGAWSGEGCHYHYRSHPKYQCDLRSGHVGEGATKLWTLARATAAFSEAGGNSGSFKGLNIISVLSNESFENKGLPANVVYAPVANSTGRWLHAFDLTSGPSKFTGNFLDYTLIGAAPLNATGYKVVSPEHVVQITDEEAMLKIGNARRTLF